MSNDQVYLAQLARIEQAITIAASATATRQSLASRELDVLDGLNEPAYLQLIQEIQTYLDLKDAT